MTEMSGSAPEPVENKTIAKTIPFCVFSEFRGQHDHYIWKKPSHNVEKPECQFLLSLNRTSSLEKSRKRGGNSPRNPHTRSWRTGAAVFDSLRDFRVRALRPSSLG